MESIPMTNQSCLLRNARMRNEPACQTNSKPNFSLINPVGRPQSFMFATQESYSNQQDENFLMGLPTSTIQVKGRQSWLHLASNVSGKKPN